ncbi:TPA: hypothetical protein DEP58_00470 [Patescibacteria group bacterium]|nr:MAG: N-methylation motif domain protein [Parcubacteria group bacterium GW2011_GWD2_42_14]HCC04762.1 hypothetical protein [Patescibacteria group bacterium]
MLFPKKKFKLERGFTLTEVLVVIALLLILSALSIGGFRTFAVRSGQAAVSQTVLGALKEAHAKTLASLDDTTYGVHFESSSVTIFQGGTYTASSTENSVRELPTRTSITNVSLTGGSTDVVFARLTGTASSVGTVTVAITSDLTSSQVITIHKSGLCEISS